MINSYTSWQPLEEVIVGRAYPPDYFDFIDNPQVRNQLQQILNETEEDLQNLARTIEEYGACVRRPDLPNKDNFVWFQTQGGGAPLPPLTPRDWQITLGDKLLRVLNMQELDSICADYADQVDIVKIHFPDEAGNMKGWKPSPEWEYAFIGIQAVVGLAGIHYEAMTMSDHGVHPAIRHLPGVGVSHSWSIAAHDRAGTLDTDKVKAQPIKISPRWDVPITCGKAEFYDQNVLLPNGDVVLCCMDYDTKHIIGNLVEMDYDDLFRSDEFARIMEENARPCFNNETLCKACVDARPA